MHSVAQCAKGQTEPFCRGGLVVAGLLQRVGDRVAFDGFHGAKAGIERSISLHKLRHYLFTWLKTQGIDDALIQPYSGHSSRESLEVYSRLALADAQDQYETVINQYPI